ncbi:MAG: heavy metal translocating P-type ATPase, partial [Verrucomicrobiota bacterium]
MNPADSPVHAWKPMAARSAVCLVAGVLGWVLAGRWPTVSTAAFMVAFLAGGWDLAREVWTDLRILRFDAHFLMLLVVPGSVAVGALGEAALLLFLFSASSAMESFAAGRTRREIDALMRRAPKTAVLLEREGAERRVPVESLKPGDILRVTAGELAPVDLSVLRGQSACDESSLTGESEPIPKVPGDAVMGGTLNLWGVLEGRVLRPVGDSALHRILNLILEARHLKAPSQRFTDRFGTAYTGFVLLACLGTFLHQWQGAGRPPFFTTDGQASAFYRAMTLLVVLSPCALVLSVPSAILSAIASGARRGVLFRGGAAIENLAGVGVVCFDKTGTLTEGRLAVDRVEVFEGAEGDLVAATVALARVSNHPVSRSIARGAEVQGLPAEAVEATETVAGKGLSGRWRGLVMLLGNREFLAQREGGAPASLPEPVEKASETWIAGRGLLARWVLKDALRPQSKAVVGRLREAGLRTVMLTGDRVAPAREMAAATGVDEVRAGLKPEDKVAAIREFQQRGGVVAMIGDG